MKKYIGSIVLLLVGFIFIVLAAYGVYLFADNISDRIMSIVLGFVGCCFIWMSGNYIAYGVPSSMSDYLNLGQVVRLRGFYELNIDTAFVMVEIKPGEIRFLEIDKNNWAIGSLKLGHWYQFLGDKFIPIPIGEKN